MLKPNQYKVIVKLLKLLLLAATLVFIVYKLFVAYKINTLWYEFLAQTNTLNYWFLIFAIVLVGFNWGIEVLKWKFLLLKFEPITYLQAVKSILSGVALSVITPNQLGDFLGRVIHLNKFNKIKGSLVAVVGHTAQVLVTITLGLFATIFLLINKQLLHAGYAAFYYGLAAIIIVILMLLYVNLTKVFTAINQIKALAKIHQYLLVFEQYKPKELMYLLALSFLRYGVFLTQYFLLLWFFGVKLNAFTALWCIVATFCVQSIVPSFILLEVGLRGASAMWFFGMYSNNIIGILLSAYSLWIINIMIPAVAGLFIIYKTKFVK